jgi:hypothetical protein
MLVVPIARGPIAQARTCSDLRREKQRGGSWSYSCEANSVVWPSHIQHTTWLSPHPARFLRQLARVTAKHATRDSTKYTRCARSFRQYHGQRISHAIVMTDALNIHDGILKLKKMVLQRRAAWTRGTGW